MHVSMIEGDEAAPFIKRWHYSGTTAKGDHYYFGWVVRGRLYAVADYGSPTNKRQAEALADETMLNVTESNLVELKRLCRAEPKGQIELTWFLARCHRVLRKLGKVYIISFSDPAAGHDGGIYKAANFQHLGKTERGLYVVDAAGNVRHRKYAYRYAKANGLTIGEAYERLGLRIMRGTARDRWFLCINKKRVKPWLS